MATGRDLRDFLVQIFLTGGEGVGGGSVNIEKGLGFMWLKLIVKL